MNAEARANRRAIVYVAVCFLILLGSPIVGLLVTGDMIPFDAR